MALTEESRYQLFQGLSETLGSERASTLMELLPPVGWADVATKHDLEHVTAILRSETALLGSEIRSEMAQLGSDLRSEMAQLGSEIRAEMALLGSDLRSEAAGMSSSLRVEIAALSTEIQQTRAELFHEQRNQAIAIIGANATIMGILLTVFHFV